MNEIMKRIFVLLIIAGIGFAGGPNLTITQSMITPRLNMFNDTSGDLYRSDALDDTVHYRTFLSYQQSYGSLVSFKTDLSYGSPNYRFTDEFQIHSADVSLYSKFGTLNLGRLNYWNSFANTKYDGARYSMCLGKFGKLGVSGGSIPQFAETEEDPTMFMAADWTAGTDGGMGFGLNVISYLYDNDELDDPLIIGGSLNGRNLLSFSYRAKFSFNVTDENIHSMRFRLSRQFNQHELILSLKQRQIFTENVFPGLDEDLLVAPTLSAGVQSRIAEFALYNRLIYRMSDDTNMGFSSSIQWRCLQFGLISSQSGDYQNLGWFAGLNRHITQTISANAGISLNSYDYDDLIEARDTIGAQLRLNWRPCAHLSFQVYGMYIENPYYDEDGRGGINVSYTL